MDLTIQIENTRIITEMYEKSLNLYFYILSYFFYPPGVLTGLVIGMIYFIRTLTTHKSVQRKQISLFYQRLLRRGYSRAVIRPLFCLAQQYKINGVNVSRIIEENEDRLFFHVVSHPDDPSSRLIQKAWQELILKPLWKMSLSQIKNREKQKSVISV